MMSIVIDDYGKVEQALQLFPYFDTWNSKTIRDCCRLSRIKIVPPDGIIIGSEDGFPGVHFVMDGTCKLIEHLSLVRKKGANGGMIYSVFRDKNLDREISSSDEPKYSSLLFNMGNDAGSENGRGEVKTEKDDLEGKHKGSIKGDPEATCGDEEDATKCGDTREDQTQGKATSQFHQFYRRMMSSLTGKNRISREKSSEVQNHFLQIALVHKGCCLGLGENLRNRYLVAVTKVTCLVIPLQFLLQHNPNNIWNRIKQFWNDYLPKEEEILTKFLINKRGNECKRKLISSKCVKAATKISDVPMSIRLSDANMRLDLFQRIFLRPV